MGYLKLGQSHDARLALTSSFLTQPFQRYSTSNTTFGPLMSQILMIFIGNPDIDSFSVVSCAIPILNKSNATAISRFSAH